MTAPGPPPTPAPLPADAGQGAQRVFDRTRSGLSWNLVGAVLTNGLRIVVIVVLGRALSPSDFGVVAAAVSVSVVLNSFRDLGVATALVQRTEIGPGHLTTATAVSTYLGVALAGLMVAGGPTIADLLDIGASSPVIQALAPLFVLRGISTTSRMLAQRAMRFRAVAVIETGSFITGSALSIACALLGLGPWALVAGYLVEELLVSIGYMWRFPAEWSLRIDRACFRDLMAFGVGQTINQVVGMLASYGDNLVVGRALGAQALGFYTRAYDLVKFPSMVFQSLVGSVLFPAFARLQDQRHLLALGLRRVLFVNALVLLPASGVLVVLAPEVLRILVGDGWGDAVLPLQILSLSIVFRTNQKLGGLVTMAAGRSTAVATAQVGYALLVIGGAALAIRYDVAGVAVSTTIAIVAVSTYLCALAMGVSGLSLAEVSAAHAPRVLLALIAPAVALLVAAPLRARGLAAPWIVLGAGVPAALACAPLLWLWTVRRSGDFAWLVDEVTRLRRRRARRA